MRGRRLVVLAVAMPAVGAGLTLASCGAADETTQTTTTQITTDATTTEPPPPTVLRVQVVGGVPKGGIIVRKGVDQGDRVVVVVTSDVSDHIHVHGYDLFRDIAPGQPARIAFRARLPGRFVIELEDRHAQVAELTVQP